MTRFPAVTALVLGSALAHAGPVSQWGGASAGLLLIPQEQVDVLAIRVNVDAAWEGARVTVDYVLRGPPTEREVQVYVGAATRLTEREGDGPGPAPWTDVTLTLDGAELAAGVWDETPARPEFGCLDGDAPMRGQWMRSRFRLKPGKVVTLQARFKVPLTHDDWASVDGKTVEHSARALCIRARPLAFKGTTDGLFSAHVNAPPDVTVTPVETKEALMDLARAPDVRLHWPARQEKPR